MSTATLAKTAFRIAALVLRRDEASSHQCFRIKNLHRDEVVHFVQEWSSAAKIAGLGDVRLIVADSLDGAVSEEYVAEPGRSITHYRNNNRDGLVYVETTVQSDEQGLQNMFSLRDSNFLDGSFDEYVSPAIRGVTGLIIDEAWRVVGGEGSAPSMLRDRLGGVIRFVHPEIEPVPVRRFVRFVEQVCTNWLVHPGPIDAKRADAVVGGALWLMDMFPDLQWNESGSDSRCRRRLELNLKHADLMDGSSELSSEEISAKAKSILFRGEDGAELIEADSRRWRTACVDYARSLSAELRSRIPYAIFSQLFSKDTSGLKIGDRVRAELAGAAPDRVSDFDALDVLNGLNARSSNDANRLLDAPSLGAAERLVDLLTSGTRKAIERLAAPPRRQFFNPAIELVRLIRRVQADYDDRPVAEVRIGLANEKFSGCPSHGLFAFLFGPTLKQIADDLDGAPTGCRLVVEDDLVAQQAVPTLLELLEDDEEEGLKEVSWDPLPISIAFMDGAGRELEVVDQIEWFSPHADHFALQWLLVAAHDSSAMDSVGTLVVAQPVEGNDWVTPLVRREVSLETLALLPDHERAHECALIGELSELRRELRTRLREQGLAGESLQAFLDSWHRLLLDARGQFVPEGTRPPELEAFLGCDFISIEGSDRLMMMAIHPIKLRWIAAYLDKTRRLAEEVLAGNVAFADGEGTAYLDWLERLSPREGPPIAAGRAGELLYSRSEVAWWEDFSPLASNSGDMTFDGDAIASIAARITSYLDVHPYKRDGLSLLVVLPTSDDMPADLLRRIAVRSNAHVRVSLYVAAPKNRWEAIARAVEALSAGSDGRPLARLFPDRDLALIDFRPGESIGERLKEFKLDIAVVTHVLQEQIVSQPNTEAPIERSGAFDPLRDRPLRLETGSSGGSISLVMLPRYPDPILESWSTLAVRANRCRAVAPSQPENTDLIELRINFQDSARLFSDLHEHCHWVITLERHITREQVESVEAGSPDVLSLEEGVGANGLNMLIVSSRSGRDLIQARLARKLDRLLPSHARDQATPALLNELAKGIYESTRKLSPRLALQALGVARVTEEIVGITIARNLVERRYPPRVDAGLVAWISLDEHADWFGGHSQVRADMCRLTLDRRADGRLDVDALVLEGKLRQNFDAHGTVQVRRTSEFMKAILRQPAEDGAIAVDAGMWLDRVASAIEILSPEAIALHRGAETDSPIDAIDLRDQLIAELRSGAIVLRDVEGVYSACLWESHDDELVCTVDDGVTILRSSNKHLLDLVRPGGERGGRLADAIAVGAGAAAVREASKGNDSIDLADQEPAGASTLVHQSNDTAREDEGGDIHSPAVSDLRAGAGQGSETKAADATAGALRGKARLSERELGRIYQEVLGCFDTHGVAVSAASISEQPYIEGPASILFKVRPSIGVDPRKLVEKGAALKLVLALEQEQNVSFNIDRGFVTIDVPKRLEQRYFVDAGETWGRWSRSDSALAVPLGEDRFGDLVELNFSSANSPHLLVAGTTGSGKSEALNTILFGLTRHYTPAELRLMLVDPKGTELTPFEGCAYLEGAIGWDDADAIVLLERAVEEMQRRYALFKGASKRSLAEFNAPLAQEQRLPWWLIVLDEYADLTHDQQSKKDIEAHLKRLAQKARAAGIHVIIATQKPSAEVISTNLRSNLPSQLALKVKSGTESRVIIDEAGAENLNGRGDALMKAEGRLRRVQCSRVDPSDWARALRGPIAE